LPKGKSVGFERKDQDVQRKIVRYIIQSDEETPFTAYFWKGCEPHSYEIKRYPQYVRTIQLSRLGRSVAEISAATGAIRHSVRRWVKFEQMPKLAHYLAVFLQLGKPSPGWVWLSVNNTSGHAVPLGPVIEVPKAISRWSDVEHVLNQLKPLEMVDVGHSREYAFGFLVGMIIGDAAKSKSKNWHRHLGLVLSKKYQSNERIGQFTSACARDIGIRMHRVADLPRPRHKPHGFYEWVSQASPLIDWIFNVVLGLKDGERTTYDAVRMGRAQDSPEEFRRGLIQGVAESDGSVSIASQTVEFWIGPNWDFFKGVLLTFGVRAFRTREALAVTKSQIAKLGTIPPFAPHLRTPRYLRFEKLVHAEHIERGKRIPVEIRNFMQQNRFHVTVPQLAERVVDRFGVILSYETVQRWAGKAQN
jgi:hypothetical protein